MTDQARFDPKLFGHRTELTVRNYEVDWQGIVHNAVYLLYFEIGRVEYLKQIGATLDLNSVRGKNKVVLVRNEIEYLRSLSFDDVITVGTRISAIKNSSFLVEGLLLHKGTGSIAATNIAVHVWLDPIRNTPIPVPDSFRKLVQAYEGDRCSISWPSMDV
jgi:acyl-CoA thioester hydrolase